VPLANLPVVDGVADSAATTDGLPTDASSTVPITTTDGVPADSGVETNAAAVPREAEIATRN
jgi:hypothetical protein